MKDAKTHKMADEPYEHFKTAVGDVPLYKSLCGIKEPMSQAHGPLPVTCGRCRQIDRIMSKKVTNPENR